MFRLLELRDIASLAALFEEMQAYYHVPCPPRAVIIADLAALPPGNRLLVAEVKGQITGFAAFAAIYPGPGLTRGLFLKELYVAKLWRGQGIGRGLVTSLAALAVAEGYQRIDWTADRDDPAVQRFYEGLGAVAQPSKLFYRLTNQALDQLAVSAIGGPRV